MNCIQCGKTLPKNGYVTDYFMSWCSKKCHKKWEIEK